MAIVVRVQAEDFDVGAEVARLRTGHPEVGAIATFVGLVRDRNGGTDGVATLTLEHYPGMTERSLEAICADACARWPLVDVTVVHRTGTLHPTDQIVFVAASSAHRGAAFDACEFLMDYLKTEAPFWKKEATAAGERWVEARESDEVARDRWAASESDSAAGSAAGSASTPA
jgi:molybdopterin synthase catalytic subunit